MRDRGMFINLVLCIFWFSVMGGVAAAEPNKPKAELVLKSIQQAYTESDLQGAIRHAADLIALWRKETASTKPSTACTANCVPVKLAGGTVYVTYSGSAAFIAEGNYNGSFRYPTYTGHIILRSSDVRIVNNQYVQLPDRRLVEVKYEPSDPLVATVSRNGEIAIWAPGYIDFKVSIGEVSVQLPLRVHALPGVYRGTTQEALRKLLGEPTAINEADNTWTFAQYPELHFQFSYQEGITRSELRSTKPEGVDLNADIWRYSTSPPAEVRFQNGRIAQVMVEGWGVVADTRDGLLRDIFNPHWKEFQSGYDDVVNTEVPAMLERIFNHIQAGNWSSAGPLTQRLYTELQFEQTQLHHLAMVTDKLELTLPFGSMKLAIPGQIALYEGDLKDSGGLQLWSSGQVKVCGTCSPRFVLMPDKTYRQVIYSSTNGKVVQVDRVNGNVHVAGPGKAAFVVAVGDYAFRIPVVVLAVGSSKDKVLGILGPPKSKKDNGRVWVYDDSDLRFGDNGLVDAGVFFYLQPDYCTNPCGWCGANAL